jgi:hypothetical protein
MPRPARPRSVTVFAVLNILFGGMLLQSATRSVTQLIEALLTGQLDSMPSAAEFKGALIVGNCLTVAGGGFLMASGIGAIGLRPWVRRASLAGVIFTLLATLVFAAMLVGLWNIVRPAISDGWATFLAWTSFALAAVVWAYCLYVLSFIRRHSLVLLLSAAQQDRGAIDSKEGDKALADPLHDRASIAS